MQILIERWIDLRNILFEEDSKWSRSKEKIEKLKEMEKKYVQNFLQCDKDMEKKIICERIQRKIESFDGNIEDIPILNIMMQRKVKSSKSEL